MADANRTAVRIVKEATAGTIPSNPVFRNVRYTSESMSFTPQTEISNEIDSTRQVNDLILTGFEAGGDLAMELSMGNSADLLEGVMFNKWHRTPTIVNGMDITGDGQASLGTNITNLTSTVLTVTATKTISGTGGSAAMVANTAFAVGHLIILENFAAAANNRVPARVTASTTTSITCGGASFTADASPAAGSASSRGASVKVVGFQGVADDIDATASGLSSTLLNFTTLGLQVGQWVKLTGFTTTATANNGYARISAISATALTFDVLPSGWSTKTETGTVSGYYGDFIKNSTTDITYAIEVQYELSASTFLYYRGMKPASYNLNADTAQIVSESVSFVGFNALDATTSRGSSNFRGSAVTFGTPVTASSLGYSVFDSSNAVPFVLEGGSPVSGPNFVSSFSIALENNLRPQSAVGNLGAVGVGAGRCLVTGNLNTYFGNTTAYNKLMQNTSSSFTVGFRDSAYNKGMLYDLPKIEFSSGQPDVTGVDSDVFLDLGFQAVRDLAGGRDYTMLIQNFDYLPA